MPPRYTYWTILAGGLPTAFRAGDREELTPTFNRIKAKHADAEMKYFARGKLWDSPDDVRRADELRERERRNADWRPGGAHRDPRQRYEDARKARNLERRRRRFEYKRDKPAGDTDAREKPRSKSFRPAGKPFRPKASGTSGRRPFKPKAPGQTGATGSPAGRPRSGSRPPRRNPGRRRP